MLKNVLSALHIVYPILSSAALPDTGPTHLQGESLAAYLHLGPPERGKSPQSTLAKLHLSPHHSLRGTCTG